MTDGPTSIIVVRPVLFFALSFVCVCRGALDIFSQFFVSPLFTESSTGRELLAVDSEDSKNRTNDSRRMLQVGHVRCVLVCILRSMRVVLFFRSFRLRWLLAVSLLAPVHLEQTIMRSITSIEDGEGIVAMRNNGKRCPGTKKPMLRRKTKPDGKPPPT